MKKKQANSLCTLSVHVLLRHRVLEILHRLADALVDRELGRPAQVLLGPPNVRSALLGVVLGRWQAHDLDIGIDLVPNHLCKLADRVLFWIAQVHGLSVVLVHQQDQPIDQVVDVLERPCLLPVAIDGQLVPTQCLHDKIADNSAVVLVHPWSEGVEDAGHAHVDLVLVHVRVGQSLGHALALVVACAGSNGVDVAPVCLLLWVLLRIAVHLCCYLSQGVAGDRRSRKRYVDSTKEMI